jgi:hypothetical protein
VVSVCVEDFRILCGRIGSYREQAALKTPPPYAIASVDHALRAAVMLQLEDRLTVSQAAYCCSKPVPRELSSRTPA